MSVSWNVAAVECHARRAQDEHESGEHARGRPCKPSDEAGEHEDAGHPLHDLRGDDRPRVQAEDADGKRLQPECARKLVDGNRPGPDRSSRRRSRASSPTCSERRRRSRNLEVARRVPGVGEPRDRGQEAENGTLPDRLSDQGAPELASSKLAGAAPGVGAVAAEPRRAVRHGVSLPEPRARRVTPASPQV